jgi:hypothetical protein
LEAIDANSVSESISPLCSQGRQNIFGKQTNDFSLSIDDYLVQKKNHLCKNDNGSWWFDNFEWLENSKKSSATKCGSVATSTAASLPNEIFESPIISLQSSNVTCSTLFSSSDISKRKTYKGSLRKKKYNWVSFYAKIKAFRKTRFRLIRKIICRKLIIQ